MFVGMVTVTMLVTAVPVVVVVAVVRAELVVAVADVRDCPVDGVAVVVELDTGDVDSAGPVGSVVVVELSTMLWVIVLVGAGFGVAVHAPQSSAVTAINVARRFVVILPRPRSAMRLGLLLLVWRGKAWGAGSLRCWDV
jgi:hypothetical protein